MPRPVDSGGSPHPRQSGCFRVAFGGPLNPRHPQKLNLETVPALQGARPPLRPTGFSVYASPALFTVPSAPPRTQDSIRVGGWLTLTRQGLSPRKMRRALLGAKWHQVKPLQHSKTGAGNALKLHSHINIRIYYREIISFWLNKEQEIKDDSCIEMFYLVRYVIPERGTYGNTYSSNDFSF